MRFLYTSTSLDVADKFENLTQGSHDIETLIDDLRRYTSRMKESPTPYQLKRRFLQALCSDIAKWVISLGITLETHSLDELVSIAKAHEASEHYSRSFHTPHAKPW